MMSSPAWWSLPHDASLDGWRIDRLLLQSAVVAPLLLAVVVVWLAVSALAWNRRHAAVYDLGTFRHPLAVGLSLFAAAVLLGEDAWAWRRSTQDLDQFYWAFSALEANPAVVRIEVMARQWAWSARYAGPDGSFNSRDDVVTLNEVRIPVGAPVVVELTSGDVIHSLSLPNFRVKQDAVPGRVTRLTFTATETGDFEIACAQHCGLNHYKMRGVITALSAEDYRQWLSAASRNAAQAWDPDDAPAHWGWSWEHP